MVVLLIWMCWWYMSGWIDTFLLVHIVAYSCYTSGWVNIVLWHMKTCQCCINITCLLIHYFLEILVVSREFLIDNIVALTLQNLFWLCLSTCMCKCCTPGWVELVLLCWSKVSLVRWFPSGTRPVASGWVNIVKAHENESVLQQPCQHFYTVGCSNNTLYLTFSRAWTIHAPNFTYLFYAYKVTKAHATFFNSSITFYSKKVQITKLNKLFWVKKLIKILL